MNRKISLVLIIALFVAVSAFAETDFDLDIKIPVFKSVTFYAVAADGEGEAIITSISNNEFYLESLRLTKLALETYEFGDYDASAGFAEEAIRYAQLSDEYVSVQLIAEAKRLLDWADANNIKTRHPRDYDESKEYYEISVAAHSNESWPESIDAAISSIEILSALESGVARTASRTTGEISPLPSQYTVRTWASVKDCLWNIAGQTWAYNDPWQWRTLYEANKSKMPEPDNPDLIEPGMILDIPSIRGETRQGMWSPTRTYRP